MKNDQWFDIGDKVMQVSEDRHGCEPAENSDDETEFGKVYCVAAFWAGKCGFNMVDFVGFNPIYDGWGRCGFLAINFRKVEEIKLCVAAVNMAEKPKEKETV